MTLACLLTGNTTLVPHDVTGGNCFALRGRDAASGFNPHTRFLIFLPIAPMKSEASGRVAIMLDE